MDISGMAALLTPRAWVFDDTPHMERARRRRSGPLAAMRRSLLLLVAVSAMALMLAGSVTSAGAVSRGAAVDGINSAIDGCFAIGGDPIVGEGGGELSLYCDFEDGWGFYQVFPYDE